MSAPTGGERRTALLLPVASAQQAVQLAAALGLQADAVPSTRGVLLLPRGGADVGEPAVTRASRALRRGDVLVLRLADERVAVERWRAGRLVDTPHYGVVGGVDGDAERVLLGRLPAAEAEGATSTDGVEVRAAARVAVASALGPVRGWQVGLALVVVVGAALFGVLAVVDLLSGTASTGWALVRAVLWGLVGAYWSLQLRALLRRRRAERA